MNRSWRNTTNNSSTGFVYFNTNTSFTSPSNQNSSDTADFLSFGSDSSSRGSPHSTHFSPLNYSSPRSHYYGKSPRQRGGRNQYYSPIKQSGGKFWRKSSGLTGSFERNINTTKNHHNFSENQHSGQSHQMNRQRKNIHQFGVDQSFSASSFYDPTSLQDPWAELEQKIAEDKKMEQNVTEPNSSQSIGVEVEEASSDESESENDSEEMEESYS